MSKKSLRAVALAVALAVGGGGLAQAVHAQAPADNTTQAEKKAERGERGFKRHHHHGHKGPHGFHGGFDASPVAVLGAVKSKLNLSAEQQQLWDAAREQGRGAFEAARTQREAGRKALDEQLKAGAPLDLRALAARHDADRAAIQPKLDEAREAWFKVYDSLDAKQKQVVADAFKKRAERGERMRERFEERMKERKAPPPAPQG